MPNVDPTRRRHRQAIIPEPTDTFAMAAAALRAAEHVCVLTGAGISAESGIPTFRGALQGFWSQFRPEDLATPAAFARQPEVVWRWYTQRRVGVRAAQPNAAHLALVAMSRFISHTTLVTQNVDDLHQRAGSRDVVSLHGSITRVRCSNECGVLHESWEDDLAALEVSSAVPTCHECGALLRPDVVWFGETLPSGALAAAQSAALACDVFLSIGTSNVVEPAASLPWIAAQHGATVIVINPTMDGQRTGPSILPLVGSAGAVVPALIERAFVGRRPRARHLEGHGDDSGEELEAGRDDDGDGSSEDDAGELDAMYADK